MRTTWVYVTLAVSLTGASPCQEHDPVAEALDVVTPNQPSPNLSIDLTP